VQLLRLKDALILPANEKVRGTLKKEKSEKQARLSPLAGKEEEKEAERLAREREGNEKKVDPKRGERKEIPHCGDITLIKKKNRHFFIRTSIRKGHALFASEKEAKRKNSRGKGGILFGVEKGRKKKKSSTGPSPDPARKERERSLYLNVLSLGGEEEKHRIGNKKKKKKPLYSSQSKKKDPNYHSHAQGRGRREKIIEPTPRKEKKGKGRSLSRIINLRPEKKRGGNGPGP